MSAPPAAAADSEIDLLSLPSLDDTESADTKQQPNTKTDSKSGSAPVATASGSGGESGAGSGASVHLSRFRKATLTDHLPTRFLYIANCGAARGDTDTDMRAIFARYGRIQTIVLPPGKPFSIVCFATPVRVCCMLL